MVFTVDQRIEKSSVWVAEQSLSTVFFKKDASFPWLILVPRVKNITEIYQLKHSDCQILMEEIKLFSKIMNDYFKPDKLNIGALGNIVSQLHIHIVARFKDDKAWPHSIWQPDLTMEIYEEAVLAKHVNGLQSLLAISV